MMTFWSQIARRSLTPWGPQPIASSPDAMLAKLLVFLLISNAHVWWNLPLWVLGDSVVKVSRRNYWLNSRQDFIDFSEYARGIIDSTTVRDVGRPASGIKRKQWLECRNIVARLTVTRTLNSCTRSLIGRKSEGSASWFHMDAILWKKTMKTEDLSGHFASRLATNQFASTILWS